MKKDTHLLLVNQGYKCILVCFWSESNCFFLTAQSNCQQKGQGNGNSFSPAAITVAKSLQSRPTLCDPIDGSPPGSHPWDSPGKNTGVGCHFLLQCMKVKSESEVAQLSPTLGDPMDCSPPGSSIHGIFQARVMEWVAISFSNLFPRRQL